MSCSLGQQGVSLQVDVDALRSGRWGEGSGRFHIRWDLSTGCGRAGASGKPGSPPAVTGAWGVPCNDLMQIRAATLETSSLGAGGVSSAFDDTKEQVRLAPPHSSRSFFRRCHTAVCSFLLPVQGPDLCTPPACGIQ